MTEKRCNNLTKKFSGFRHFWDYYRLHCIITCILIIAAILVFKDLTDRRKTDLNITMISAFTFDNTVCNEQLEIFEKVLQNNKDLKELDLGYRYILLPEMGEGQKTYQDSTLLLTLIVEISEGVNCIFVMDENAKHILLTYQEEYFSMICEIPEQYIVPGIKQRLWIGLKDSSQSICDETTYQKEKICYLALYQSFTSNRPFVSAD